MGEVVGMSADVLAELRADTAAWKPMVETAPTLPRELRSVLGFRFDADRYRQLAVRTVLLAGSASPPEMRHGVDLLHAATGAPIVEMAGVDHEAVTTGPDVLIEAITGSLGAELAA
jgi:hypothetical protein